jgi:dTDP-4-amino-4,6-dideoxygalactose transaminase
MKKAKTFLPFAPPLIGKEEIAAVLETLRSDWITTGPKTKQFEEAFRRYVGAKAALAVNSCTAALHLALAVSKVGRGDEVITTPMTFCSGVNVIEHVGARPVLADIDPVTLNIDPKTVEKILKKRGRKVKALIVVQYGGHPCDMDALMRLARRYKLVVIEDAAHALPALYKGKMAGTIGDFGAYSFYVTKNMTTAEGGMLTGSRAALEKARVLSLHGMSRDAWNRYSAKGSWFYEVTEAGFKYNMTDLQSALGLAQLKKLHLFQKRRREIVAQYHRALSAFPQLQLPVEKPGVKHAWHLYPIRLKLEKLKINRNQFIEELKRRGVSASVHFIPVHLHPYYRKEYGWRADDFPIAYREYQRLVSLPLYPKMTGANVRQVLAAVRGILRKYSKPL